MTLLDRFRTQARDTHPDPAVRLAYVQEIPIDQRDVLAAIARSDDDVRVRRAAVAKLMDPSTLADIARADGDEDVRAAANGMLRDLALEAFEGAGETESRAAVETLADPRMLSTVAKTAIPKRIPSAPPRDSEDRTARIMMAPAAKATRARGLARDRRWRACSRGRTPDEPPAL